MSQPAVEAELEKSKENRFLSPSRPLTTVALTLCLLSAACSASQPSPSAGPGASPAPKGHVAHPKAGSDPANMAAPTDGSVAYTPTGPLVADTGFRPETDGFGLENYGSNINGNPAQNMTAAEVRRLFGDGVCADLATGQCDLSPEAQSWMDHENTDMSGGHCYGFSVASLLFWKKQEPVATYGAGPTPALPVESLASLQQQIAYSFEFQVLNSVFEKRVEGTPNQVLDKLIDVLKADNPETYTIGITKADGKGGHAVTPYAVEDKGPGKMNVLIYDNNYPKVTRAITFDRDANTWTYDAATNPKEPSEVYNGDATTKSLTFTPTSPGLGTQPCPFCKKVAAPGSGSSLGRKGPTAVPASLKLGPPDAAPMDQIYLQGSDTDHGHLLITNPAGQRIGFLDNRLINEIPGARVQQIFSDQDWKVSIEPDYYVPDGPKYNIAIDGRNLVEADDTMVGVITPSSDLSVDSIRLNPGETDSLTFTKDATSAAFTAGRPQQPTFALGVSDDTADYAFTLTGSIDTPGGTVDLAMPPDSHNLAIHTSGAGAAKNYAITLVREDDKGVIHFKNDRLPLAGGDSAELQFANWDSRDAPIPLVTTHNGVQSTQSLNNQGG